MKKFLLVCCAIATCGIHAATNEMVVNVGKTGAPIQKTMYGIFFEDINYAADGGLYAEMVKNRSFEFPQHLMGWKAFGKVEVKDDGPFERNPHYVRLSYAGHKDKHTGLENEGFFGIATKKDASYRFSVWARCPEGGKSRLVVQVVDNASIGESQVMASCKVDVEGKEWKKYTATFTANATKQKQSLRLFLRRSGKNAITTTDVEHISLFPTDTWMGRENGMRRDLAQALSDLQPGVFRFPGGCIVEGTDLATRYQWKNSVGPVENRPLNENRWHYTFEHRFFPDYYQSYGLGFFEFFQLCEDFGCEALPVISCGLSCQFQNPNPNQKGAHVPTDSLDEYIQDALDLIEFANGSTDTKWGKVRADMGHPSPFGLHYLAIGNEQWDYKDNPAFTERLKRFLDVLKKRHPEIKYIGTTGPDSEGSRFEMLQPKMKELKADLYDEHFYRPESWFTDSLNRHRYDNYDRKGPKVFAGEYACHGKGKKWNHFNAALLEAAFMTGFERNADIVHMATYAPLFAHIEGWQWRPDMIWYDNLRTIRTCSYYVQQLYSRYKGTNVLPLTMNGKAVAGDSDQNGLSASAVKDNEKGEVIIKVVNTGKEAQPLNIRLKGIKNLKQAESITLHADDALADNTLDAPDRIAPKEMTQEMSGNTFATTIPANAFCVYILK
ncbi:MAG: alpha-L-arabinofuranosidase C-terminal domain-containing protein [Prevotella sp.]|nr:alpha-L-arabinofuranosidase C-terminal domain-containing protein [Prevotella sp.]